MILFLLFGCQRRDPCLIHSTDHSLHEVLSHSRRVVISEKKSFAERTTLFIFGLWNKKILRSPFVRKMARLEFKGRCPFAICFLSELIDGLKAYYLNYSPSRDIESRAYFTVKNDHVYRILFNYFQPLRKDFLPTFEKTVASIHIK